MSDPKPSPGSPAAVFGGCRCPVVAIGTHGSTVTHTQAACPIHGAAYEEHVLSESYERMPPRKTHTVAMTFLPAVRGVPLPMDADECEYLDEEREGIEADELREID